MSQVLKLGNKMKVIDIAPKTSCNGFSNWATFNACLHCDNDAAIYADFKRLAHHGNATAEVCENRFLHYFPNGTIDMDGFVDIDQINWDEFAEHMNAE